MPSDSPNVRSIFEHALDLESDVERGKYLDEACRGAAELRQRIDALLRAYYDAGSFLESPAADAALTVATLANAEAIGTKIGPYKLLQQIGEGGMGTVYMAEQTVPVARKVALKIIKPGMDSRQVIARFEAERQALALMDHPNIAKMLDAGTTGEGRPYFVMELVRGISVVQYCDEHRLDPRQRLGLFITICNAVQHAHQKGIIHRDLKPSNVLVADFDNRPVAKIIDFGVAKAVGQQLIDRTMFTEFGQIIGTIEYMSPEQAKLNQLDIDTRTDIYSLGVLLYELLTGSTPLDRVRLREAAFDEVLRIIREEEPPKPSTRLSTSATLPSIAANRHTEPARLSRSVRGDLDWIVMKCLEKERSRRYETASELAADLERHLDHQPVLAVKPTLSYRASKYIARHKLPVAAATIVCLAVVGGAILSAIGFVRAVSAERVVRQQRDEVTSERDRAVRAEATAEEQRQKAEAEARRAQLQVADSLISEGDALTTATEYRSAYSRFAEAEAKLKSLSAPLTRLNFSLVRLYRASPPPLWSAQAIGNYPWLFAVLKSRQELLMYDKKKTFHVLDLVTGAWTRTFDIPAPISQLATAETSNGPIVVLGYLYTTRIIDPVSGAVLRHAEDDRAMKGCTLSPDGSLAASINQSGEVVFWETGTMKIIGKGRHGAIVETAAFSHDGKMVATVAYENTVVLWDPQTGKQIRTIEESPNRHKDVRGCSCVTFSADDKSVICGEWKGMVAALSVEGQPLYTRGPFRAVINSIVASTESNRVLAATRDGIVEVFEPDSDVPPQTLAEPTGEQVWLAYVGKGSKTHSAAKPDVANPDGEIGITIDFKGNVRAWPLVSARRETGRLMGGMSVSRDGLLVSGLVKGNEPHVRREVRDFATGRTLRIIEQSSYANASCFSANSTRLYTGEDDGTVAAFDLQQGRCDWAVHGHDGGQVWSVDASADGKVVATGGNDGAARVWSSDSGKLLAAVGGQSGDVRQVLFAPVAAATPSPSAHATPDAHTIYVGAGQAAFLGEWEPQTEKKPRRISLPGYVKAFSASRDGKLLAVGLNHGGISLLDAKSCESTAMLSVGNAVNGFRWIATDNKADNWGISAGVEELRVWDVSARQQKLVLDTGSLYGVNTLVGNPEGTKIIAARCGAIDLQLPEKLRQQSQSPSLLNRAELYAAFGLWNWVEPLLARSSNEQQNISALLAARSHWMCGNNTAARQAFELALARNEVPKWYAEFCLSADTSTTPIAQSPPQTRPADPGRRRTPVSLPPGVVSVAEFDKLKAAIGQEVVVEGDVHSSLWSNSGNVMTILFDGETPNSPTLNAIVYADNRPAFDAAFNGDVATAFAGARLHIKGKIVLYGGRNARFAGWPQIILDNPAQVTIVP